VRADPPQLLATATKRPLLVMEVGTLTLLVSTVRGLSVNVAPSASVSERVHE
jgi:hypothetical protein